MFGPGIYEDISNADYHADKAISSTSLKKLLNATPAHFKYALDNRETSDSDALLRGSVLHAMLLEPDTLSASFVFESHVIPDKTKLAKNGGGKETWDALKEKAQIRGLPLVKYDIYQDCIAMRDSVLAHPHWPNVKSHAKKEISLFAEINGVRVKARYDAMLANMMIIDLKTSRNILTTGKIQSTIAELGYHFSAAMYTEVGKACGLPIDRFVWIFIESFAPYSARFVEASEQMMEVGKSEFYKCLEKYKTCMQSSVWDAYSNDIDIVHLPNWYANKETLFEIEGIES